MLYISDEIKKTGLLAPIAHKNAMKKDDNLTKNTTKTDTTPVKPAAKNEFENGANRSIDQSNRVPVNASANTGKEATLRNMKASNTLKRMLPVRVETFKEKKKG